MWPFGRNPMVQEKLVTFAFEPKEDLTAQELWLCRGVLFGATKCTEEQWLAMGASLRHFRRID